MRRETGATRVSLTVRRRLVPARPLLSILIPRICVLAVVEILRELRQLQRMEGVAHHRKLVRLVRPDALLREARLRPVWKTGGMEGDRAHIHPTPRAELAGDVIDHLLRLQVRMVVRDRHCEWIEVELARTERADHEVPAL